jgi:putative spermidine/putrescine transport system ATP-binding protein
MNACPKDAHTLNAEVLEFIYMGDIYRTRLRVAGKEISSSRHATPPISPAEPGEKIKIGWQPQDCRALDA